MVCHSSKAAAVESDESDEGSNEANGDAEMQAQAARQAAFAASAARYEKLTNQGKRNPVAKGESKRSDVRDIMIWIMYDVNIQL